MHIDFEISQQDYLDGCRLSRRHSPSRLTRWGYWFPLWFGLPLLVFFLYSWATEGFSVLSVCQLAVIVYVLCSRLLMRRQEQKLYAKTTAMHGPLSLDIDDSGLQSKGQIFSSNVGWGIFPRFCEGAKGFILYHQNERISNLIPKRGLSPEQITTLRQYLERNVGVSPQKEKS